jgi:hypothetical protein
MRIVVVITSINAPTKAVEAFSTIEGVHLVVVGDKKSPAEYQLGRGNFLSCTSQSQMGSELYDLLPFNHYSRKMMGYLFAIRNGAEIIIDTDDDNIPIPTWHIPEFRGKYRTIVTRPGFVNVYELYSHEKIWPRGLPLRLINSKTIDNRTDIEERLVEVGIWQGLADGDPDVDAVYRLTDGKFVTFEKFGFVVLDEGVASPFNSQNTFFRKDCFPLLYLPSTVTFRFTDILRSIVAQPVLWAAGLRIGFTDATVSQERNLHDYMKDFESEIPMYLRTEEALRLSVGAVDASRSISQNLTSVYEVLCSAGIVQSQELEILEHWVREIELGP